MPLDNSAREHADRPAVEHTHVRPADTSDAKHSHFERHRPQQPIGNVMPDGPAAIELHRPARPVELHPNASDVCATQQQFTDEQNAQTRTWLAGLIRSSPRLEAQWRQNSDESPEACNIDQCMRFILMLQPLGNRK